MATYKRTLGTTVRSAIVHIAREEAARRKRHIQGDGVMINNNVAAAATGVTPLVRGRFSLVAHHGMVA